MRSLRRFIVALAVTASLVGAGTAAHAAEPQPQTGILVPVNGGPGMQCFELFLGSVMHPLVFCLPAPQVV